MSAVITRTHNAKPASIQPRAARRSSLGAAASPRVELGELSVSDVQTDCCLSMARRPLAVPTDNKQAGRRNRCTKAPPESLCACSPACSSLPRVSSAGQKTVKPPPVASRKSSAIQS